MSTNTTNIPQIEERGWEGLPPISKALYKETYFRKGEDYDKWVRKISSKYANDEDHAKRMETYIRNYWYHPSTPISSDVGLPISCYLSSIEDTKQGIFNGYNEGFWLGAEGGGRGVYWGNVRNMGSPIGDEGATSSGVIPFLGVSDRATFAISQANVRRSTEAVYLKVNHPDIEHYIEIRLETGDKNNRTPNLHHGVVIDDHFMECVASGEPYPLIDVKTKEVVKHVDAFDLWIKIIEIRKTEAGEPFLMFVDTINNDLPEEYYMVGYKVETSNLCCLTGDTPVRTKEHGTIEIKDLVGKEVTIFDGENWVKNNNFKCYGEDEVYEITLSSGVKMKANKDHRWFVAKNYNDIRSKKYRETITEDLKVGDFMEGNLIECKDHLKEISSEEEFIEYRKIISIKKLEKKEPVYCPQVETTKKFLLGNGIITGNTEIKAHTSPNKTAVCNLGSINVEHWDEFSNDDKILTQFIEDISDFHDNVASYFINKVMSFRGAKREAFQKALNATIEERNLGIGVMGWHNLLQSKMIPFESPIAIGLNKKIFKTIREKLDAHQERICTEDTELICPLSKGVGTKRRNIFTMAVAPTMSISNLCGATSSGIEPWVANAFVKKLMQGSFTIKNKFLDKIIREYCTDDDGKFDLIKYDDVWKSIIDNNGSVQHLEWMDKDTKDVFKTAFEIDQRAILNQASDRQKFIDQMQSVNLFVPAIVDYETLHTIHYMAWQLGVQTLYYLRSEPDSTANVGERERQLIKLTDSTCVACE